MWLSQRPKSNRNSFRRVEDTSSCPSETRIPENLLNNDEIWRNCKTIKEDISDRLEMIVEKPITFDYKITILLDTLIILIIPINYNLQEIIWLYNK
jgi:hypothetical protein